MIPTANTSLDGRTVYSIGRIWHREDGPALEYPANHEDWPGFKAWYLNDRLIGTNDKNYCERNNYPFIRDNEQFLKLKAFL